MKLLSQEQIRDYSDKRVMLPLSGGINSMAVLCFLGEEFPDEKIWRLRNERPTKRSNGDEPIPSHIES